jgi:hypothetical protein
MKMAMGDIPAIGSSAYGASTSTFTLAENGMGFAPPALGQLHNQAFGNWQKEDSKLDDLIKQAEKAQFVSAQQKQEIQSMSARRLVKVVIVDPNENVPLNQCILYSGEEKLTDATDQELFFEIDIKQLLDAHNEKRVKVLDKKVKERTEYLEPAKIRELKMVVVNIASF